MLSLLSPCVLLGTWALPLQSEKLAPELAARVESPAHPAERQRVYAVLCEGLDAEDLARLGVARLPRGERQRRVAAELRAFALERQAPLLARLAELEREGAVARVRPLWILNAVSFEGTPAALLEIAARPEVARLGWDAARPLSELQDVASAPPAAAPSGPGESGPTPNLVEVQANALWDLGFRGQGMRILMLDGGTDLAHPDLANRIWENPLEFPDGSDNDGNGLVDDFHGWDFVDGDNDPSPVAFDAHGTHTAGILVGDGSGTGLITGMAPEAVLAVTRVNAESDHWLALQYAVDQAFDCTSSSYSYKWSYVPKPDYHAHRAVQEVLLAAGILHANSIGNQGSDPYHPVPFQVAVPGSVPGPWRHPAQIQAGGGVAASLGCGAVFPGGGSYSLSSLGPCAWENVKLYAPPYSSAQNPDYWDYPVGGFGGLLQGLIKPDVVAPTNVTTTTLGGGYTTFGGTSASTPHLGGASALLFSVNPHAEPRHLAQALQVTALDLGPLGKDVQFGAGELRVRDAALRLVHLVSVDNPKPSLGEVLTISMSGLPSTFFASFWGTVPGVTTLPFATLDLGFPLFPFVFDLLDASGERDVFFQVPFAAPLVGVDILLQSVEFAPTLAPGGAFLVSPLESFHIVQ
jgi:subtilisin family serine protease